MSGFFVLDVPEFVPLVRVAEKTSGCTVYPPDGGYWFVEFNDAMTIHRADTEMSEAVWFGCLTAGLSGKIARFDSRVLELVATNEPILEPS